ncbi:MAG TPA: NAD-dependent epimerase/dehydratase family protein [Chitinophagaceae bacterium]|nr:NAD-dependent epimerase/dehydratase family protein [Chitinophagaceae bacterium]
MKILVTGAGGFIGYHVIHNLLQRKHEVMATDISREAASHKDWFQQVIFAEHTINDNAIADNLFEKFNRPDKMIHLAWKGLPNYKESFHMEENLPHQFGFLKNLVENGLKDLLVAGTCFEYGMQSGCLKEDMPAAPNNPYALAKDTLRQSLEELRKKHGFLLKWPRLFYLYGNGQNPKSLLSQLEKALQANEKVFNMSKGDQQRDYLPVETMADYIVRIALQNKVTGVINCCSGKPVTVLSLVKDYLKQSGKTIQLNLGYYPYPDYEPMEFWGDTKKLAEALSATA